MPMATCAGCGKQFDPPQSHWRYCYECWMKTGKKKFFERKETDKQKILRNGDENNA